MRLLAGRAVGKSRSQESEACRRSSFVVRRSSFVSHRLLYAVVIPACYTGTGIEIAISRR